MTPAGWPVLRILAIASLLIVARDSSAEVAVEPYVGLHGGLYVWPAYSNRDEVEADTAPGFSWGVVGGLDLEAHLEAPAAAQPSSSHLTRLGGRLELEVGQRYSGIHGINDGPIQQTGDGKTLLATSVHVNLWPSVRVAPAWRVYAGGGGGGTWIRGLGSDKRVWSGQAGLGVLYELPFAGPALRVDLGWRSFFANSTKLRDALADFDAHGAIVGIQAEF